MRHRPSRFDPEYRPFSAPKRIYIVPLSRDASNYQALVPTRLSKNLPDLLIQDKVELYRFKDCTPEAVADIKAQLGRGWVRGPVRYSDRVNRAFKAGIILVVLGIVNFIVPDPLPWVDEFLMIGVGVGLVIAGYLKRLRVLLREKNERAAGRLDSLECAEEILLTRIHEAIKARGANGGDPSTQKWADPFELESRWLVEYLDLQQLIDSKTITIAHLESLLEVLSTAFPLSKFLSLERKLRKNPKNRRARAARYKMAERYGLSADAFTVYAEFYRLAREITTGYSG